ncbi:MAG: hypothetical protein A3E07_01295 [Candidatus Wildermuthbacteria bacterium RIFCSPHIGHO2_12_FULL_45_9]|nr:MAG: hypothetical protein A2748_01110 [Candidatus Wildermuthbacteria bacterium RIFCSPHIGHO2_01_FULL_45_20]OHA71559.1 MAG: hypothetical protein A3E07_01295 [Candidatus Wildermuthbacteria bacterium RIFCSPHIGHO2_12_FULL_45_9]
MENILMEIDLSTSVIKIAVVGIFSFLLALAFTPWWIRFLYIHKMWRKTVREHAMGGGALTYFKKFHTEGEVKTPRFGGVLIWFAPLATAAIFYVLSLSNIWWFEKFNFLSRNQTWLPFATLIAACAVGFLDDIVQVVAQPSSKFLKKIWPALGRYAAGGLHVRDRLALVALIGFVGALWFYYKLDWSTIHVPGVGDIAIGIFYIPLFVFVMLATYSGGVIDGIDGLSGGVFSSIFAAFGIISLAQAQIDLAAFCFVVTGAILAFLWFNIPPARFYMGETGTMGLTAALTVVAFLTDSVLVLPIIAFLLLAESASVIIQVLSKKIRKKKVFLAAPIHHHFEALGWPSYNVTMRFWIVGVVAAILGVAIRLLG